MPIYPFTSVDYNAIQLFSLETTKDLIHIRNTDDDSFFFQGPKCHLGKENLALNDTSIFKMPLIFNSDNVSFIHMLNRLKNRLIDMLVEKKDDFFNEDDLKEVTDAKQLIDEIFLEPYNINASKGIVKINTICNPRSNTRWANEYKLKAKSKDGTPVSLNDITSNTPFYPVINVRGIRTKENFFIEFILQEIILESTKEPTKTPTSTKAPASTKAPNDDEPKEINDIKCDDNTDDVFKVKKPKSVYKRFVSQFESSLYESRRQYLEKWMKVQDIRNPDALLERLEDEIDDGYESQ